MPSFILIVICLTAALTTGCMPRQAIKYPMNGISTPSNGPFANAILTVKPLADTRKPLTKDYQYDGPGTIEKDGKEFFYNSDHWYKSDSVATEITKAMADHIRQAGIFREVIMSDATVTNADYYLTGQVSKFDGLREYRTAAAISQSFGLVGALFTVSMKTSYEATTTLEGLQLIRAKDSVLIWSGDVTGHIEGEESADPYGWSAYWKANLSLKEAVDKLLKNLLQEGKEGLIQSDPIKIGGPDKVLN